MTEIFSFLALSITLGISGAIQPGPLTALVISQSIRFGTKEGIKIAIAPLITDAPIIILVTFILAKFSHSNTVIGIISLLGAGYLAYLAFESFKAKSIKFSKDINPQSIKKEILTNLLNPAPYLFWLTLGAAMIQRALEFSPWMLAVYFVVSYSANVGGYSALAFIAGKFKNALQSKLYLLIVKGLGLGLAIFSILFLIRGLRLLELIQF